MLDIKNKAATSLKCVSQSADALVSLAVGCASASGLVVAVADCVQAWARKSYLSMNIRTIESELDSRSLLLQTLLRRQHVTTDVLRAYAL